MKLQGSVARTITYSNADQAVTVGGRPRIVFAPEGLLLALHQMRTWQTQLETIFHPPLNRKPDTLDERSTRTGGPAPGEKGATYTIGMDGRECSVTYRSVPNKVTLEMTLDQPMPVEVFLRMLDGLTRFLAIVTQMASELTSVEGGEGVSQGQEEQELG